MSDTIFAFGLNWTIQRSVDAGATWTTIRHDPNGFNIIRAESDGKSIYLLPSASYWTQYEFADTTSMLLFSFNPYSSDTTRITLPIFSPLKSTMNFFDLSVNPERITVLQNTMRVALAISSDQGKSWSSTNLPDTLGDKSSSWKLSSVYFRDRLHGVVICDARSREQNPLAFVTQDGGQSWSKTPNVQYVFTPYPNLKYPAAWVNDSTLVLFTGGNKAVISHDYGNSWETGQSINGQIYSASFAPDGTGYAVGKQLDMYKTIDYGKNWIRTKDQVSSQNVIMPTAIAVTRDICLVGSQSGYIMKTADGGVTWDMVHFNDEYDINRLNFFTSTSGMVQYSSRADGSARASFTTDGGRTWNNTFVKPTDASLFPASEKVIYGFQSSWKHNGALIILSTDGGQNWADVYTEGLTDSTKLYDITGYANKGVDTMLFLTTKGILSTFDRGKHWAMNMEILNHTPGSWFHYGKIMDRGSGGIFWLLTKKDLLKSVDCGNTWHSVFTAPDSVKSSGLMDFCVASEPSLFLYTEEYVTSTSTTYRIIYKSTDAGNTWISYYGARMVGGLGRIIPSGQGMSPANFIYSNTATIFFTKDAWRTSSISFSLSYSKKTSGITMIFDENNSWFALNGSIYRTANGGIDGIRFPAPYASGIILDPAYPNPASSSATISFTVSGVNDAAVQIDVYDAMGRKVGNIFTGVKSPGKHSALFDASRLRAGVYFVRMTLEKEMKVEKLVVLK